MIREFKNGNLNIKLDDLNELKEESALVLLIWELDQKDTYLVSEEFCLSNYTMGCMLYNIRLDVQYLLDFRDLEKLEQGKTLKLYANPVNDEDKEEYEKFMND